MIERDLKIVKKLLERTENIPNILHLRAAPIGYELTDGDKELLLDTYQKLDDILKEVAAFINIKFPGRQDHIHAWNVIDFDTKIGDMKIVTTDREHTKSAWNKGIYDLKSLIKSLINEVTLLADEDIESKNNSLLDEKEWDKYLDKHIEKRADQADFFLDMIIEKNIINLDKQTVRKYFKEWFSQNKEFDLQIKDGDLAIEDGDFQIVPAFSEENIPEFLKWFKNKGNNFMDFLKEKGVNVKKGSKQKIINHGNLILNNDSKIKKQSFENEDEQKESVWSKSNVIIAFIVGLVTIIGIIWQILNG